MVKSYSEYIKEHFGAITIEYPPEHMVVKNPNLPQPLSINTWVGGTGRIPKHWNNSPYLSGGFGGSGYGRFGQDPDGSASNELDNYLNTLSEIDLILSDFQNSEYTKIALELKKDIEDGKILLDDMGPEAEKLDSIGISTEVEISKYPTSGGPSFRYDDPPDYGESGEYETFITGSSSRSDQELANLLGVKSIKDIPSLDDISGTFLNDSLYILQTFSDLGIREAGNWLIDSANELEINLQRLYELNDENYFENEGSITTDYELYDISEETPYDSLKYLIKFSKIDNKSSRLDFNSKVREKVTSLVRPHYNKDLINMISQVIVLPFSIKNQQRGTYYF